MVSVAMKRWPRSLTRLLAAHGAWVAGVYAQETTDISAQTSREDKDDVVVAALVIGVVACVGVVCLSIVFFCYLLGMRKRQRANTANDLSMTEKSPPPPETHVNGLSETSQPMRQGSISAGVGTLRQVSLSLLQDLLLNLYNVNIKRSSHAQSVDSSPHSPGEQGAMTSVDADEVQRQLKLGLIKIFPQNPGKVETFLSLGQAIMTASTVRQLSDAVHRVVRVCLGVVREWGVAGQDSEGVVPCEGAGHVEVELEDEVNCLKLTWDEQKFSSSLLATVSMVCQALRDERRQPTPGEYLAVQMAYHLLGKGQQMADLQLRPLGCPGFRQHVHTQVALTDSGYGHLLGSTRRSDWLQGVIVHVQRIGSLVDKAHSAPSLYDFAKVRLHVGDAAPTTFFLAREGARAANREALSGAAWEAELSRMVDLTSAAFYQGAAACHVSMAGLTTSQAVTFMTQLRPLVRRERHVQALSAVWDLGAALTDDYGAEVGAEGQEKGGIHPVRVVTEPHHIARRAIEITLVGGFDQIAWFSSCDENDVSSGGRAASQCVLRVLAPQQVLSLVHQAHGLGLLAAFMVGVSCDDIQPAVLGGADSVGVGGVGLLHEPSPHPPTGGASGDEERVGPFMEENIPAVLACRDAAARSPLGRAAQLLARLDTMFFEGSLASAENGLRIQLFDAIVDKDETLIRSVTSKLQDIAAFSCPSGHPLVGVACRLVARKSPALKDEADSAYEWAMFVTRLRALIAKGNGAQVCEEYAGEPWHTYRKRYRERREGNKGFFRQVSFEVSLKNNF